MCRGQTKKPTIDAKSDCMKALIQAYETKVIPSEKRHLWSAFDTPPIRDAELLGKPTILLLGQYSVGKTSMISYLLDGNYPGADIGPEPTTDIFAHVSYAEVEHTIPGTTLASDNTYQFQSLSSFGDIFLNKLRATNFKADLLKFISIIDTPGILSGEKQVAARGYDFAEIIRFMVSKVDFIFLMFDASKLDISDEYKQVIEILEGYEEKIKIVLNKADSVRPRELIHVRGALMWALGKIMKCSEVPKVYIGSFWQYWSEKNVLFRAAIQEDLDALEKEIANLPSNYHAKRVNDVVRRARNLRIHTYLMDEIVRSHIFFKKSKNATDIQTTPEKLIDVYHTVARKKRIVFNDFPNPIFFHTKAKQTDAKNWNRLDSELDKMLNSFLDEDVSLILAAVMDEPKVDLHFKLPPKKAKPPEGYTRQPKSKKAKNSSESNKKTGSNTKKDKSLKHKKSEKDRSDKNKNKKSAKSDKKSGSQKAKDKSPNDQKYEKKKNGSEKHKDNKKKPTLLDNKNGGEMKNDNSSTDPKSEKDRSDVNKANKKKPTISDKKNGSEMKASKSPKDENLKKEKDSSDKRKERRKKKLSESDKENVVEKKSHKSSKDNESREQKDGSYKKKESKGKKQTESNKKTSSKAKKDRSSKDEKSEREKDVTSEKKENKDKKSNKSDKSKKQNDKNHESNDADTKGSDAIDKKLNKLPESMTKKRKNDGFNKVNQKGEEDEKMNKDLGDKSTSKRKKTSEKEEKSTKNIGENKNDAKEKEKSKESTKEAEVKKDSINEEEENTSKIKEKDNVEDRIHESKEIGQEVKIEAITHA